MTRRRLAKWTAVAGLAVTCAGVLGMSFAAEAAMNAATAAFIGVTLAGLAAIVGGIIRMELAREREQQELRLPDR